MFKGISGGGMSSGGGGSWGSGESIKVPRAPGNAVGDAFDNVTGKGKEIADNVGGSIRGASDVISWIKSNWQLSILGLIAILVLLRD